MKYYFYSNTKNDELKDIYTVYQVEAKDNVDVADRRARTMARKHKDILAGGYFNEKCKPYNFKNNYKVIKVPLSTRVAPYNAKDKFIIALIEAESR